MRISQEEFDIVRNYLVQGGWLTETWDYKKNKGVYNITPTGMLFYKTALGMIGTTRIYDCPTVKKAEIDNVVNDFTSFYTGRNTLLNFNLVTPILNKKSYALTKAGAEWFYVMGRLKCKKTKSSNTTVSHKAMMVVLESMYIALYAFTLFMLSKTERSLKRNVR